MSAQLLFVRAFFWLTTHVVPVWLFRAVLWVLTLGMYRRFVRACRNPAKTQEARLLAIVRRNRATAFGRQHHFLRIENAHDFRRRVPVRRYEDFEPYIQRMLRGEPNVLVAGNPAYYALTSGTTGRSKYIPCPQAYIDEYRQHQRLWFRSFALAFPGMIRGNPLTLVSNKVEGRTAGGALYGSISRPLTFREHPIAAKLAAIPRGCFLVEDFDAKYYVILRMALGTRISTMAAVNPSTLMLFCDKLNEFAPRLIEDIERGTLDPGLPIKLSLRQEIMARIKPDARRAQQLRNLLASHGLLRPIDVWPDLCGLACWKGGSAPFYLNKFAKYFGNLPVLEFGYVASEGAFSTPLDTEGTHGVFAAQSHFVEFIPEAERNAKPDDPYPRTLLAHELEPGQRYYVIVTGSHGLYRYDINDIVEVTGFFGHAPYLVFIHKGGNMLSVTGEKIGESHAVRAVTEAALGTGVHLDGFSLAIRFDDIPRYVFAVETRDHCHDVQLGELLDACDAALKRANLEYEAKRDSGRLGPPLLRVVEPGSYQAYRRRRVAAGAPDAHVKPPYLFRTEEAMQNAGFVFTHALRERL